MFGPERNEVTGGWTKQRIMRSFITCAVTEYHLSDQIKEDEMRMSHASGRQKYIEHFGYEAWKEETTKLK